MHTHVEQILEVIDDVIESNKKILAKVQNTPYGPPFCEGAINSLNDVRNQIVEMFEGKK